MNHSKKERIISSIEQMDIGMLDLLLNEESTYQDARKEVFLNKLNKVFSKLKKDKDTALVAQRGGCKSTECPNTGCSGYAFVGNNSANYLSLVFKEEEDDYSDIFNCNDFVAEGYELDKEGTYRHRSLLINYDEKAAFVPDTQYLINAQKCKNALDEIAHLKGLPIHKDMYTHWVAKHKELFDQFDFFDIPSAFTTFVDLYSNLDFCTGYLSKEDDAADALVQLENIDTSKEEELIPWLLKYERINKDLEGLELEFQSKPPEEQYFDELDFKIDSTDYQALHKFIKKYNLLYGPIWEKYYVEGSEKERWEDGYWGLGWHLGRKERTSDT